MKIYKYIVMLVIVSVLFTSCEEFLDERPSKNSSVSAENLSDIENLLNNFSAFEEEEAFGALYGTDDFNLSTAQFDARNNLHPIQTVVEATWDIDFRPQNGSSFWTGEWEKIFSANLILRSLNNVSGSDAEKAEVRAEAHFVRAYSYFQLVNSFCLPYSSANTNEMGLPIKTSTSFEESAVRVSLEATWAFMEADLQEALKMTRPFGKKNDLNRVWRASTAAVNAFAARFHLAKNDYVNAQLHAQKALDEYDFLNDYNTEMSFTTRVEEVFLDGVTPTDVTIFLPITWLNSNIDDVLAWGETYYHRRLGGLANDWYPSPDLLGSYDQVNDLRYVYHMVEDYTYMRGARNPAYSAIGYAFIRDNEVHSGPSVSEMLLIKAECQVRQGEFAAGITTANILRAKRMDNTADASLINLSATSQADALTKVLQERRRELPFVHRWYDLRRYNNNDDTSDDVVITRNFYEYISSQVNPNAGTRTYELSKDSRRYAMPIPETEILSSRGELEQNQY